MMKTLAIEFEGAEGARLNFSSLRTGFMTQVQSALVNLATERGSDRLSPRRGTQLLRRAVSGRLRNIRSDSRNAASFAAIDTLFFLRAGDAPNDTERAAEIKLQLGEFQDRKLNLHLQMVSTTGETVGILANV